MRFFNRTDSIIIDAAIDDAQKLLLPDSKMLSDIKNKNDWKFNSGTGSDAVIKLITPKMPIDVYHYKPIYPWSAALGYYDGEAIYINYKKVLNHEAMVGLLLHEYAHYCGFMHGNNRKTREKVLFSVPYWLSSNVGNYL